MIAPVIDLPYVIAGQGASSVSVDVANDGDAPIETIGWSLDGDPSIALDLTLPAYLAPGEHASLELTFAGAHVETIAKATLHASAAGATTDVPVFAVAGDPDLGASSWDEVDVAGGVVAGHGVTVAMPAAPYPDGSGTFSDPSVRIFLPADYRDRGSHDVALHFHGFNAAVAETLASHLYQEHVYASGANTVLVVPQGPLDAPSGDFGKLMQPGGVARLLDEVLVVLYRDGRTAYPVLGDLTLTSHSGGYQAVATSLDPAAMAPPVRQVDLFDSIYGYDSTFESFAVQGGLLRSDYTSSGGTLADNQAVAAYLASHGVSTADAATDAAMRDSPALVFFAPTSHDGSTRIDGAYGEQIRWASRHSRTGPRIELRTAIAAGGEATVTWLAPHDDDVTGFVVETSSDGAGWTTAAATGAAASSATFPLAAGAEVRVRSIMTGLDASATLPSDTYRVDPAPKVLVVDGFDRVIDGSFGGLHHDFAAVVGAGIAPVATISHRAVSEDGFDLSAWPAVVWLLGDESIGDHALAADEQQALRDYVDGGGSLVLSGSEVGWELSQSTAGADFVDHCFGATFVADDSGSYSVTGEGALAGVGTFGYAGPNAPYVEDYPDALGASASGTVVLRYGSGQGAAVGVAGQGVMIGFPLELVDDPAERAAVVTSLVQFAGG